MKVAAASCAKVQSLPSQPAWAEIQAEQPDVLLLLGDNIYLDRDGHTESDALATELRSLYLRQFAQPEFAALVADMKRRACRVVAIYDDHDFLGNNRYGGDNSPALCEAARGEFVRAFAPQQTGTEVYSVYRLGLVDLVIGSHQSTQRTIEMRFWVQRSGNGLKRRSLRRKHPISCLPLARHCTPLPIRAGSSILRRFDVSSPFLAVDAAHLL